MIVGVDPGKEGFITTMSDDGVAIKHYPIPKIGREVDLNALCETIMGIAGECVPFRTTVVIEDVHAIPGSGAGQTFNFGGVCWAIRMGFTMCGFRIVLVAPKKWQKEMYEGIRPNDDKKAMSVQAAKRLFPGHDIRRTERCKTPDDNLTDSLLIAEYARRHFTK